MSTIFNILILFTIATCTFAAFEPLVYKDCKSTFKVTKVDVDGCSKDANKCGFTRGQNPSIKITFTPNRDVAKLKANVRSKVSSGSTFIPFKLNSDDACAHGISCPLKAGQEYTYTQSVEISNTYPIVDDVQVNWVLTDEDDDTKGKEICIVFLAKVTEA